MTRGDIVAAVARVLDDEAGACLPYHRELGNRVADRLGLASPPPLPVEPLPTTEPELDPPLDLGVWVDDAPGRVVDPEYLERLRALPISHIAVMVESSGGGFDQPWPLRRLEELRKATPGLRRIVTLWPEPTARYMRGLAQSLGEILAALGSDVVELDLEGHWKSKRVGGFRSLDEAGAELRGALEREAVREIEVTTFPMHGEARAAGAFKGEARLFLQTYSVAVARGQQRAFDGRFGPDRRPFEDILRARKVGEPGVEVCAGLAAWAQEDWPADPDEAMRLALESARRAGVRSVRWWSSKWIVGARRNRYAAKAIEAARPLSLRRSV